MNVKVIREQSAEHKRHKSARAALWPYGNTFCVCACCAFRNIVALIAFSGACAKRSLKTAAAVFLTLILFTAALLTSGCWDKKEIENRGYVLGVAVDTPSPEPEGRYDLDRAFQQNGVRRYRLSFELRNFQPGGGSSEKAGKDPEKNMVFSAEGESFLAMTRATISKVQLAMFLEDMQVMLISEEVAREGIRDIFDAFTRDPEMRRRARIYVTKGRAEDFFKLQSKTGEINSIFLAKLTTNAKKSPGFSAVSELGFVSRALHRKQGFSVPILYLENKQVKAAGTALFNRKGRMAGIGDEYETIGGKIWRKTLKQGMVVIPNPDNPEAIVVFELYESKVTVKPIFQQDSVRFSVEGELSGNIAESMPLQEKPFSNECLQKIAQALADEYTGHAYAALRKLQSIKADTMALGDLIRRKNPQYWEKIKDRWEEEIFPTVEADVKIKVTIKGTGMTR